MFGKLKNKLHRHNRDDKKTVTENVPIAAPPAPAPAPEPKHELQRPPPSEQSTITPVEKEVNISVIPDEKPTPEPEPMPEPETVIRDLWRDALAQLPPSKQEILKGMGLDNIRAKQEECEKKFWKVSFGGEDIVLRDYTTKILGWLEKAGDIAIQFAPANASLPWEIVKSLMEIPVNEGEQMGALLGTAEKVVRVISRGQVYEQVYLPQDPDSPMETLQKNLESGLLRIYATALELLADAGKLLSRNTARRTLEAIVNPGKASGALASFVEQEDRLLRDVQACESKRSSDSDKRMIKMLETFNDPIFRIDQGVTQVLDNMEESERIKMLEWISSVPFGENHDNISEKRTPGTGEWLLQHEDFRAWVEKKTPTLLWLEGSAGAGKTYLTSKVVDHVRGTSQVSNKGFAFFYCDRNEPRRAQGSSILQSFVRQLSATMKDPGYVQPHIKDVWKEAREKGTVFRFEQCRKLIQACLGQYESTKLIIDAMDECDSDTQIEIIEALKSLMDNTERPVKIFISSRPDSEIRSQLQNSSNINVSANANQDDIRKYIDAEIDRMGKSFLKTVKASVIDKLLARCQGMFQWASLQMHQILKCGTKSSVMKRLDALPDGIREAYDEIWNEIEKLEETDKILAKRAILWVMAAKTPFTSTEIFSAIRLDMDSSEDMDIFLVEDKLDEEGLLSVCNNFLTLDTKSKVWRFTHLSVMEYLESKEHWSLPSAHCHVSVACLSYFNSAYDRDFPEMSKMINPDEGKEVSLEEREESDDGFGRYHPFHVYMRQYWMYHVRQVEDTKEKKLASLLKRFLGSPEESSSMYRTWNHISAEDMSFFMYDDQVRFYGTKYLGGTELSSADVSEARFAIFGMCGFGFESILSGWWETADYEVSRTNIRGHSLLCLAAMAGSVPICKTLVERGANVNERLELSYQYGSALVVAASFGQIEVVKYLVDAGADVNMQAGVREELGLRDDTTALSAAVKAAQIAVVKYLLQDGKADVNLPLPAYENYSVLLVATFAQQNLEILKLILQAGADVNTTFQYYGSGILHQKIRDGKLEDVKFLVNEAKIDVNKLHMAEEVYPIELAASDLSTVQRIEILKFLIQEAGADVNALSEGREYGGALAAACASSYLNLETGSETVGSLEAVKWLVDAGADVNKQLTVREYLSALATAARQSNDPSIVRFLIESGADVNMQLENGEFGSALMAAASATYYEDYDMVACLLEAGAEVTTPLKPEAYRAAIANAVLQNQPDKVKAMVEAGAAVDVNLKDEAFGTILAYSTLLEFEDGILETLIAGEPDVNREAKTARYGTALIAPSCFSRYQAVECLIKAGARVWDETDNGPYTTAIQAAGGPLSEADRACIVRFFNFNESEAEKLLEKWAEQKDDVVKLLKQHMPPPGPIIRKILVASKSVTRGVRES
ncbi:uncharacterized protein N7483_009593 [Penicillium malachiteum]|uniref:uncharacterized protein n=1 Tax=Penicillium malachiteum TaxID=1324776 RepID=UPI0025488FB7|nr:uncharacterized protein N7483_009593 [Penicillium malachiteum]KAJ5721659.1 hypothetical protein N7483_009593 [Penicillium malachiteum]